MKLSEAVDSYLARRRTEGIQLISAGSVLRDLCRHCGNIDLCDLTAERVRTFLNKSLHVVTRISKQSAVRCFAQYHFQRNAMPEILFERPIRRHHHRLPAIYTQTDIRALLNAVEKCQLPKAETDPTTIRMMLLLLYATGITIEEILTFRYSSIDIVGSRLVLAGTFSMPARTLPIGADLKRILTDYLASIAAPVNEAEHLFRTRSGRSISRHHLWRRFKRLHKVAGINTRSGRSPSPRDLRYSFAVHRLTSWIQDGENLNELVPALSTYMGYASLTKAEKFLAYSPERFRTDLCKLSPEKAERHWRNEHELLDFLSSL